MNCEYLYKKGVHRGERCKGLCYIERYCYKHRDKINENINIPIIRIVKESDDQKRDDILNLKTSNNNKLVILKHYNNMKKSDPNSTEYYKNQIFIDTAMSYPWSKMYNIKDKIKNDNVKNFLENIRKKFDENIYGMDSVKNEILNVVCKFITNPNSNRNNIALCGPAGVGKSKFIKILSDILGIPMKTISLGGIKDSSFFLGHGYVYVESGPGKIIQNIIDTNIENPIIYFDELDKVSGTEHGKDIFSFLCYLTDPTQNDKFSDHYFYGMNFDLQKVFYVFTFNDITKIDSILLDRLNIINITTPEHTSIIKILENYCIPEILINIGIKPQVTFDQECINTIINSTFIDKNITSGIREYYRIIEKILLELNKNILLEINIEPIINITGKLFEQLYSNIKQQINIIQGNNFNHMYI